MSSLIFLHRDVPRWIIAVAYAVAALVGGFATDTVIKFCVEHVFPAVLRSGGTSTVSVAFGPLIFALIGGLPAYTISYYFAVRGRPSSTAARVLATSWTGPVVMAVLLFFMTFVLFPQAIALSFILTAFVGLSCAVIFAAFALIAIASARLDRLAPGRRHQ